MSEDKNKEETKNPKSTDGKVLVDKEQLDTILNRLKVLETQVEQGPGIKVAKEVKEKTARMRIVDGQLVIGFEGSVFTKYNEKERKEELFCTLKLENGKTKVVNYNDFLVNAERVDVKVVKQRIEEVPQVDGEVEVRKVEDYKTVGTDVFVPMEVITPILYCDIITPNGAEMTITSEALNV